MLCCPICGDEFRKFGETTLWITTGRGKAICTKPECQIAAEKQNTEMWQAWEDSGLDWMFECARIRHVNAVRYALGQLPYPGSFRQS